MNDESEDDKCNCVDCYVQPNRKFRIKEGKKEPPNAAKTEEFLPGIKRGFFNPPKKDDAASKKRVPETPPSTTAPTEFREIAPSKQKPVVTSMADTIECEKVVRPEMKHEKEEVEQLKCAKCTESNDTIDIHNQAAFKVTCTDGCSVTLHRNCFEKALGSGKKKELKTCICPTDDCGNSVLNISHRIPNSTEYVLWLRCEVKESERPKKEEKGKEAKKKEEKKDKDKYKRDRREEYESRRVGVEDNGTASTQCVPQCTPPVDGNRVISLALSHKTRDEEVKKSLAKPLPADLEARPMERKEDAVMSKYAVKESNTKENRKKHKKEVRQVVLPGLTVKGQRGKKEEDDPWNTNDTPIPIEEMEANATNGSDNRMDNNSDVRYEEGRYGFAMPEEVPHPQLREGDWRGGMRDMMTPNMDMNSPHSLFHHPLPFGNGGIFRPILLNEDPFTAHSPQPYEHNGHDSLSGFTESPGMEEPPLIEDPYDYPTLERDSVRKRKELVNFFEIHTPVLEENAALFDSPQIDLDQLKSMLENFIEFQYYGNEEEKKNMTDTLHSIFTGEVENDIIPFLIDLQCFKYGYVDGRLVVSVKTEGIERREREEVMRREREEREEEMRRREEKKQEEVKRAVMALEKRRRMKEEEERELLRLEEERQSREQRRKEEMDREGIRMEEERRARDHRRKEEEERRKREAEQRRREEADEIERKKREMEEEKRREDERRQLEIEYQKKRIMENQRLEEKRDEEKKERKMMEEEEERRRSEDISSKNYNDKKTKQMELERKTREAINTLRNHTQSKSSSSESSPERKQQLVKCTRWTASSSSSLAPPPPSSSSSIAFSTSAPPFVPRFSTNSKAELNPNAPAFVPTQSTVEVATLIDENGAEANEMWIETNKLQREMSENTIEELNRRIAELEAEKMELEDTNRQREMEMLKKDGTMMNESKMNQDTISHLQSQMNDFNQQIVWKDQKISQIFAESEQKSDELNRIRFDFDSKMEEMQSKINAEVLNVQSERREKESVMERSEKEEEDRRRGLLERKTGCAKDAIILCTQIMDKLATDHEARVMTSIFIDLRKKWMEHYSILKQSLDSHKLGQAIDWAILALKEPSMPRETDDLVQECYVWHYNTMHALSFRLGSVVKKYLNDRNIYYEDEYIVRIIQKWMKIHKDPSKIEATVPQVANMVVQAMGDACLFPPKYVHLNTPAPPTPTRMSTMNTDRTMDSLLRGPAGKNEPKGWKKASDKLRHVDMHDHECSICLEDTEGGDISYCEQVSCNEPYHNECLDQYWKTGGRNCPRCRTPMPPRDAFPALG